MAKPPKVFFLVHKAHSALIRAVDRRSRDETGLSMTQQGVLFLLDQQDGLSVGALAQALSLSKSSLSGLIDRMEDRGLVHRAPVDGDGRRVVVHIEERARALVAQGRPLVRGWNAALLAPFDAGEQRVIARFLTHVADHADEIIDGVGRGGKNG